MNIRHAVAGRNCRPPGGRFNSPALLLCLLLLCGGCAVKQPAPEQAPRVPGQFTDKSGAPLNDEQLVALLGNADYILVGERHDNAVDHLAQNHLLRLAAQHGQRPALGLEMLPRGGFEAELRDFSRGAMDVDALPQALQWQETWGYDFALYRPLFATAREFGVPVYGLNISNALRKRVSTKGIKSLRAQERARLPKLIALPLPEQRQELQALFLSHGAMRAKAAGRFAGIPEQSPAGTAKGPVLPVTVPGVKHGNPTEVVLPLSLRAPFERFLLIQSLWDSTMAEEALAVRQKEGARPLLILAGGGHVAYGRGIAYRLSLLEPQARILTVMPFSGEPEPGAADVYYYSPYAPRKGYGLSFERQGKTLRVKAVTPDSRAEKAGLKADDILVRAGDEPMRGAEDLHKAAAEARRQKQPLRLGIIRDGRELSFTLE